MKSSFELGNGEKVILKDLLSLWLRGVLKNAFSFGYLVLTNKRLVLIKRNIILAVLIGAVVMSFIQFTTTTDSVLSNPLFKYFLLALGGVLMWSAVRFSRKELFNLALKEIVDVQPTTYGLNKSVILIRTTSKETFKVLVHIPPKEWTAKFEETKKGSKAC